MEKTGISTLSREQILREMKLWQADDCGMLKDYDALWEMFRAVIKSSSYGTSEYGGPVWLMDFSLANLQKLLPDNPWLEALQNEWSLGKHEHSGVAKSDQLVKFSEWFNYRAQNLITWLGLGNVLVKVETSYDGALTYYGWAIFLDVLRSLVGGYVQRFGRDTMMKYNFSLNESEAIIHGMFPTCLKTSTLTKQFPHGGKSGFSYFKHSDIYGDCYQLEHFSLTLGYVIPETIPEKFLILVVNDLMECKAQGYGSAPDQYGYTVDYPKMKFDRQVKLLQSVDTHFQPTVDIFRWNRSDGRTEEIAVDLPEIKPEFGEFWHRQFPPTQNWRELPET